MVADSESGVGNHTTKHAEHRVFVLDKHGRPLMPCHPARARELLDKGRARVHRAVPFAIRIIDRTLEESSVQPVGLGVDPGSRTTGLAVFTEDETISTVTGEVAAGRTGIWLGELVHRGLLIRKRLQARAQLRRSRRSRNLRYRAPRFNNRHPAACDSCGANAQSGKRLCRPCQQTPHPERNSGLRSPRLAPSLQHRVDTTTGWVNRLRHYLPISGVVMELARFDTHLLANPDVSGIGYQQGELQGYEVREYLLEKWGRRCVYCDAEGTILNLDHLHPKSRGGSDRVSNLAPACISCNQTKGSKTLKTFLADDPVRLARIERRRKQPLADAAAMNATRWALKRALETTGLPVEASTGGRTKHNRARNQVPKTHALDALCVGTVDRVTTWPATTHIITATGRGTRKRVNTDKHGFPTSHKPRKKLHFGFATGDLGRAIVPTGKKAGTHIGRVAVRASGSFRVGTVDGINQRHIKLLQRVDGYSYSQKETPMATHMKSQFLPALNGRASLRGGW